MARRSAADAELNTEALGVARLLPAQHAGLWEHVADTLRTAIVTGELAPGTRLVEWELAARLGVSRGPVRDALLRLEQEHLVVANPRRGAFVLGVTAEDIRELFGLRAVLEAYGAELAVARLEPADLDELQGYLRQMGARAAAEDVMGLTEPDLQFHRGIVRLSGNRRLLRHWEQHTGPLRALLALSAQLRPRRLEDAEEWHRAIFDGLAARDVGAAQGAIREHLANTQDRLVAAIEGPPLDRS